MTETHDFSTLLSPAPLAALRSPNRVKYAACSVSNFNHEDGSISERELARMKVISGTGAGIITNQGAYPDAKGEGKAYQRMLSLADDRYIPQYAAIADMIHEGGAIAIQQILHGGRYGGIDLGYCVQPSKKPQTLRHFRPPREMSVEAIKACQRDHAEAARRSMEAGFDGVEITSFMGYLLSNFISSFTNERSDEYGGSLENRCRFMVELIEEIRATIGQGVPLIVRLNGSELLADLGGNSDAECLEVMQIAEQAGVDMISLVVGWHESRKGALGRDVPTEHWLKLAERAKAVVDVPIAFGPRFGSPVLAENALAAGKIDFWEVCRPMLADPQLLNKVRERKVHLIRPCVGGLLCLSRMFRNLPYICAMNPRLGHEVEPEYTIRPAVRAKRVLVIGGGPAGMECALAAAQRGHQVMLFEASDALGGQLRSARREIGGGHIFEEVVDYYRASLDVHGVEVSLNTPADRKSVEATGADVCVVATGASYLVPRIERPANGPEILDVQQALSVDREVGKRVVVVGGQRAGLVAAEFLASQGHEVEILEAGTRLYADVIPTFKWRHMTWLEELKLTPRLETRLTAITESGVRIESAEGEQELPADVVIFSAKRSSNDRLIHELEFSADELYSIGDSVLPRALHNAVHEGYKLGVRI
ncbi:MAG: NADH oxidase [Planctomycetota bacterium]|nr:MAG: NADH oxidase [Planctomycetota bacterium]